MRNLRALLLSGLLAFGLIPGPAFAGTDSGLYVGLGVGQGSVGDIDTDDGDFDFDGDDTAWKLIAGYNFGYIPLIDLAIEASYVDFGKPDDNGITVDADGIDAFGLVGFNLGVIGVFAKAGIIAWDADASAGEDSASDDGFDPAYGIGARFSFSSFQVRAEYEYFDIDAADDVSLLSASFIYTF